MNLEQIKNKNLDDILFIIMDKISKKALPIELHKTDDFFLKNIFDLYNKIEENDIIAFNHSKSTGFSTAICFLSSFYSLNNKNITFVVNPGNYKEIFLKVYDLFMNSIKLPYEIVYDRTNEIKIKLSNEEFCIISFLSDLNFDIKNLNGIIIFDTNNSIPKLNLDKYRDIIKNKNNYIKLLFNFPNEINFNKLIKETEIKKIEIKIF